MGPFSVTNRICHVISNLHAPMANSPTHLCYSSGMKSTEVPTPQDLIDIVNRVKGLAEADAATKSNPKPSAKQHRGTIHAMRNDLTGQFFAMTHEDRKAFNE